MLRGEKQEAEKNVLQADSWRRREGGGEDEVKYPWYNWQRQLSEELLEERSDIQDGGSGNHLSEVSVVTIHLFPHSLNREFLLLVG